MSFLSKNHWIAQRKGHKKAWERIPKVRSSTKKLVSQRYANNIQPVIGCIALGNVRPLHCKAVLNLMNKSYAGSTIRQTYITMGTMFRSAVMNDLILKHAMDGVRYTKPVKATDNIKFLTIEGHRTFLEVARRLHNYCQYALILEKGLRYQGTDWTDVGFR